MALDVYTGQSKPQNRNIKDITTPVSPAKQQYNDIHSSADNHNIMSCLLKQYLLFTCAFLIPNIHSRAKMTHLTQMLCSEIET